MNVTPEDIALIIKDRMLKMGKGQIIISFSSDGSITQVTSKDDFNAGDIKALTHKINRGPKTYVIKSSKNTPEVPENALKTPEKHVANTTIIAEEHNDEKTEAK